MLTFRAPNEDTARTVAEGFATVTDLPPALLAEAILAKMLRAARVPRRVLPAPSPADARALLDAATEALEEHGLARSVPAAEAPPELHPPAGGDERQYLRYDVDDVVAPWLAALGEQASRGRAGRGQGARKRPASKRRGRNRR